MSLTARPATADDYSFFAELQPLLDTGDPVPPRDGWVRRMMPSSFIYERSGEPVGFAFTQSLVPCAYVRNVMVSPRAQHQGVGRFIMNHQRELLRARGATHWCLNVKPDNVPAMKLYESVGMRTRFSSASLRIAWNDTTHLDTTNARVRELAASEDATVERDFDITPGLLTSLRPGSFVFCAERNNRIDAVARFDPHFPGIMPVRVREPSLIRPLFDALRAHAQHDFVQLFVENDDALVINLEKAGAMRLMNVLHLLGTL